MVFFDQNTPAGEWRAQARCCEEQNIALHRNIAFALAVADLLQLPDDLPLMPADHGCYVYTDPSRRSCEPRSPESSGTRLCSQWPASVGQTVAATHAAAGGVESPNEFRPRTRRRNAASRFSISSFELSGRESWLPSWNATTIPRPRFVAPELYSPSWN